MKHQKKLVKLAVSSILGASLYATSVWSLGLGEIESKTQLNEPLQAKIKLLSAKEFTQEDLSARIASFEAYGKFGVIREAVHGQLKFQIETHSDGSKYINVTSSRAIKEPFLNFLVELNWPQGRLLREYTVLLDPPSLSSTNQEVVSVTQPEPTTQPVTTSRPISRPVAETKDVVRQSEPKTTTTTNQATNPKIQFNGDTWRVGRGETLWSIATRIKPEGATVPQTLAALYRNNPSAFINNDIDRLKAGATLSVPASASVRSVSENISYNDLKSNGSVEAPLDVRKTVNETAVSNDETSAGRLTISSVTESELADTSGTNVEEGAEGTVSLGSQDELEQTVEALRLENEQLRAELEAVKTDATNGVALEDETLSVIAGSAEAKDSEDEALQSLAAEAEKLIDSTKPVSTNESEATQTSHIVTSEQKEKSFWQQDGFWKWPLIILGALLTLFGLGFVLKRRQNDLEKDLFVAEDSDNAFSRQQPSFTSKPMAAPEVETDPLDQADILIARGRLDEVEALLIAALDKEPENHVARVKLMEVYSSNDDIAKLKAQYVALPDSFDHDSELGLKVAGLMQLHQEPVAPEVETSLDDEILFDEEAVFGSEISEPNLDLSEELDNILDQNAESSEEVEQQLVENTAEAEIEASNVIEFSLDEESGDDSNDDAVVELSDEEVNTKLELAKAYISMGDDESAVEILKEVQKDGSSEQKHAAEELLADL